MRPPALILAALSAALCAASGAVTLVQDGEPAATVILPLDASQQVKDAAAVLVDCIREASGAELPVATMPPRDAATLCIGAPAVTSSYAPDLTDLDKDGFEIRFPDERTVWILGGSDWGTEFGVYEFLERYVGVRWLLPGEHGTDIPKQAIIEAAGENVRQEPAFFSRLMSGWQGAAQSTWTRRMRMHGRVSFHHNLVHLFPPETYTKTHPEFFPIHNGQRFLPADSKTHHWQPCFSNPDTVTEAIANINRYFDEHPAAESYSLGINDSGGHCQCDSCLARLPQEPNFLGMPDYSDQYYAWANQVIEGVLEKHPDKFFGCLAYSNVAAPPAKVKVHPRLVPYMTYDRMKWADPELRRQGEAATEAWEAQSPTLGWYDYIYGSPYCLPRVWFHHMADYYRYGHAHGVRAMYAEAYPNFAEGPKLYLALKLQWDPELDVDEVLQEWYERCVGEAAAPYLTRYYAHWEDFWTRRVLQSGWFTRGGQYLPFNSPGYLAEVGEDEIARSREYLEQAVALAATEEQKARAGLLLRGFEYYEASALAYLGGAEAADDIQSEQEALAALDRSARLADMAKRRLHLATEVLAEDPVLAHPLPLERFPLLQGDNWASGSLWGLYDWVAGQDGSVRKRVRELAESSPSEAVREQADLMLALVEQRLEPMTENASFEAGEGQAADDWSWWVKFGTGSMARTDEQAHTGSFSVVCDGMRRGGPVQVLPVAPGKYALLCFVYVPEGQTAGGTAELSMTLRDEEGTNLPSPATKIVPRPGRWTAMAIAHAVPEKIGETEVKQVLPILIVDGFAPEEKLYIDDLIFCRLEQ